MSGEVYGGDMGEVKVLNVELSGGSRVSLDEEDIFRKVMEVLKANSEKLSQERMLYRIHDIIFLIIDRKLARETTNEEKVANAGKIVDLAARILQFYINPDIH